MRPLIVCVAFVLFSSPVFAKPKAVQQVVENSPQTIATVELRFSEKEKAVLRNWQPEQRCTMGTGGKPLPKGQQKKQERTGQVSTGWQKKIARGEVLPADVFNQCRNSIPATVVRQLPPAPAGTVLIEVDGKIVRLLQATREILDVFDLL